MLNNTASFFNWFITDKSVGAVIYIVFVLVWYASSIVVLLGMQMRRSCEIGEDATKRTSKIFAESLRDQSNNREVLEELVDKQKRDKLWDIYLGTSGDMNDKITRAEVLRIRNIEKRLATLNLQRQPSYSRMLDEHFTSRPSSDSWSSVTDLSPSENRLRTRRRSSLDQKILREWKILADDVKSHANWPWAIQKLLIRRHLRRQRHTTEP